MMLRKKEILSILVVLLVMLPSVNAAVTTDYKANTSQKDEITYVGSNVSSDGLKQTCIGLRVTDSIMREVGDFDIKDLYVTKGSDMFIFPVLITRVDHVFWGIDYKWIRKINAEIYDSNGNLIKNTTLYTSFGQYDMRHVNSIKASVENFAKGNYRLHFSYGGNEKDKLSPCSRDLTLHVY